MTRGPPPPSPGFPLRYIRCLRYFRLLTISRRDQPVGSAKFGCIEDVEDFPGNCSFIPHESDSLGH